MAGVVTTKLLEALADIGVDVSKKQPSNVKTLATKNKSSATKPGLLAGERDTGGNFGTVLDIFKKEAQYIDGMNDVEQMAFLNNIMDYKEFGGKSIKVSEGIKLKDEFDKGLGTLTDDIESLQSTAKTMKDDAEKGVADAYKDLDDFFETGGQPLKKKDDRFLGGSMHEEGQLRTAIREFLKQEYKNGRIKLDKDDQFRVMEYSPMLEDDPIKVFKKIYGDEAYNKAGTFPGAFEIGENFTHYKTIFEEKMGSDLLKVKDKKYVGDGTLVLTKREEVLEPTKLTEDDVEPFAKGGRASFVGGKIVDELVAMIVKKEPMDAMKEVNKIIGKKGKYKNLTQKDIDRIVDQTNDHIFQRDPDNLFVEDVNISQGMIDLDELNPTKNAQAALKKIKEKSVDDMSLEESLTTLEGLGGTKMAERFRLKQKYPGLDEDLLTNIIEDIDPVHKASVLAKIDMAMELGKTNKSADEIIDILKKEPETKMATGGRAGYYGGGQAMVEPDLSDIGHGSDALMARTRITAPGSQATTSTGLNYLLGEDNDNTRIPFNDGLLVPPSKPYTPDMFEKDSMTLLKGMYGTGKDSNEFLYNEMIKKGNILRKQGVERETVIEIIRNNKDKINAFLETQTTSPKSLAGLADGGRIGFQDGLNFDKAIEKMLEKETEEYKPIDISAEGEKILTKKLTPLIPKTQEEQAAQKAEEMFKMVEEFQKFKKDNPNSRMSLFMFRDKKKKEKTLLKNKIIELDLKYPEKKIINDEGMVNKENLKSAIDEAEANLEISPIDGLTLKRSINTEGEQSVTSGSFDLGNLNFSSDNIEEGKLTSKGNFNFGGIDLSGMVDSNDGQILNTELGFNYDNALKGKMQNSDGYRSTELDLNKTFPISDKVNLNLKGGADTQTFDGKTYRSSDLTPKLSYNDGIFNADISKEILEGGDGLNLGLGVNYNNFYAKGDDLLSKDRSGVIGYQKEFGDKDGDLFFTAGAEKNIFDDEYTGGVGFKYKFADGGIAGLRQGYNKGNIVDKGRRGFLKLLGVTAGGVAALKTGLVKLLGKDSGAISKKAIDEVIIEGGSGAPPWLQPLVNKALREGTDITKKNAVVDGQVVKSLDTPTGKVDVYYDTRTGQVDIDYIGGNTALGESVNMRYVPGVADEGTKGVKPKDEFEAVETIPEGRMYSPDDYQVELGENAVSEVKDLYSDVSELQKLGGDKTLINDISVTLQKKKVLKKMNENPDQFASDNLPDYDPT